MSTPRRGQKRPRSSADGDKSSAAEDCWTCPFCTLKNIARRRRCSACEARRPVAVAASATQATATALTPSCAVDDAATTATPNLTTAETPVPSSRKKKAPGRVTVWLRKRRSSRGKETVTTCPSASVSLTHLVDVRVQLVGTGSSSAESPSPNDTSTNMNILKAVVSQEWMRGISLLGAGRREASFPPRSSLETGPEEEPPMGRSPTLQNRGAAIDSSPEEKASAFKGMSELSVSRKEDKTTSLSALAKNATPIPPCIPTKDGTVAMDVVVPTLSPSPIDGVGASCRKLDSPSPMEDMISITFPVEPTNSYVGSLPSSPSTSSDPAARRRDYTAYHLPNRTASPNRPAESIFALAERTAEAVKASMPRNSPTAKQDDTAECLPTAFSMGTTVTERDTQEKRESATLPRREKDLQQSCSSTFQKSDPDEKQLSEAAVTLDLPSPLRDSSTPTEQHVESLEATEAVSSLSNEIKINADCPPKGFEDARSTPSSVGADSPPKPENAKDEDQCIHIAKQSSLHIEGVSDVKWDTNLPATKISAPMVQSPRRGDIWIPRLSTHENATTAVENESGESKAKSLDEAPDQSGCILASRSVGEIQNLKQNETPSGRSWRPMTQTEKTSALGGQFIYTPASQSQSLSCSQGFYSSSQETGTASVTSISPKVAAIPLPESCELQAGNSTTDACRQLDGVFACEVASPNCKPPPRSPSVSVKQDIEFGTPYREDGACTQTQMRPGPPSGIAAGLVAFQTAGKRASIQVTNESMSRASKLLQSSNVCNVVNAASPATFSNGREDTAGRRSAKGTTQTALVIARKRSSDSSGKRTLVRKSDEFFGIDATTPFQGPRSTASALVTFQTAGKKRKIALTEEAVASARNLLRSTSNDRQKVSESNFGPPVDDRNPIHAFKTPTASLSFSSTVCASFQTAGRRNTVEASASSIATARSLLSEECESKVASFLPKASVGKAGASNDIAKVDMDGYKTPGTTMQYRPGRVSFLTAGRHGKVKISEESLTSVRSMFSDDLDSDDTRTSLRGPHNRSFEFKTPIGGSTESRAARVPFQTGRNGAAIINREPGLSDAPPSTTTSMRNGDDAQGYKTPRYSSKRPSESSVSFKTAGESSLLQISEASMGEARSLLAGSSGPGPSVTVPMRLDRSKSFTIDLKTPLHDQNTVRPPRVSFQTAGKNGAVEASETGPPNFPSLISSGPMGSGNGGPLAVCLSENDVPAGSYKTPGGAPNQGRSSLLSFHTAGKQAAVNVTETDLTQVRNLFSTDSHIGTDGNVGEKNCAGFQFKTPVHVTQSIQPSLVSFSTAGKKRAVMASETALAKAQNLFAQGAESSIRSRSTVTQTEVGKSPSGGSENCSVSRAHPQSTSGPDHSDEGPQLTFDESDTKENVWPIASTVCNSKMAHKSSSDVQACSSSQWITQAMDECIELGVDKLVLSIDSKIGPRLVFDDRGLPLKISEDNNNNLVRICRQYTKGKNCDIKKMTPKWITNHCRWIAWKLASIERRFCRLLGGGYFTLSRLLETLSRRFVREMINGERSPLRKVLNRDVAASSIMILCVASVECGENSGGEKAAQESGATQSYDLELTDGWYSVKAKPDSYLCRQIDLKRISVGTKLLVSNGVLHGADDGIDPLDDEYDMEAGITLRLSSNSTRLAHWTAKLGFLKLSQKLKDTEGLLQVRSFGDVVGDGGKIPSIDFEVVRRHPMLFLDQSGDRDTKVLTEGEEERRLRRLEEKKSRVAEDLAGEVEEECTKDVDDMGPDEWKTLLRHPCPDEFVSGLDRQTRESVLRWQERRKHLIAERMRQEMQARFEDHGLDQEPSKPFVKFLLRDVRPRSRCVGAFHEAVLTIWGPTHGQLDLFVEGAVLRGRQLSVKEKGFDGVLRLSAGGRSVFFPSKASVEAIEPGEIAPARGIFHACFASKRQSNVSSKVATQMNLSGVAFRSVLTDDRSWWYTYFTDKSGMVFRVESYTQLSDTFPQPVLLKSLTVLPYDEAENCGVASFGSESTSSTDSFLPPLQRLRTWLATEEGESFLRRTIILFGAALPTQSRLRLPRTAMLASFVEFVVLDSKHVVVKVDSGTAYLTCLSFPLSLLSKIHIDDTGVILGLHQEEQLSRLSKLGKTMRARALHRIVVRELFEAIPGCDECLYEVFDVSLPNPSQLASVYLSALRPPTKE